MKRANYPNKRSMNLYYKPDRTTKPATIALYVLFVLVCLLGLSKFLVYDLIVETSQARRILEQAQGERDAVLMEIADYAEVRERYSRYSATEEERGLVDRMEVLTLLEDAVASAADVHTVTISGSEVQLQFSGVTLAETAQIVKELEASPLVASTMVSTASSTQTGGAASETGTAVQTNMQIQLKTREEAAAAE